MLTSADRPADFARKPLAPAACAALTVASSSLLEMITTGGGSLWLASLGNNANPVSPCKAISSRIS
ncbi:hypothetical protein ACP86_06865 [Marinobacter sp. CP1]|nr:hypothetical protein ACP86_06865 [Marinobacter sp. CP1]|tara:strand:+ start:963 stop:1160 length:198 start_codon:yes stop_codon:yes gene_type:complete